MKVKRFGLDQQYCKLLFSIFQVLWPVVPLPHRDWLLLGFDVARFAL